MGAFSFACKDTDLMNVMRVSGGFKMNCAQRLAKKLELRMSKVEASG